MLRHCVVIFAAVSSLWTSHVAAQGHSAAMSAGQQVAAVAESASTAAAAQQLAGSKSNATDLHLRDYSPDGTGVRDSADAVQRWVNACIAANVTCIADPGTYRLDRTITVGGGLHLAGAGKYLTKFVLGTAAMNGFAITTTAPVHLQNFAVWGGGTQSAGAAFLFDSTTSENDNSYFNNIYCNATWTCFRFVRGAYWTIRDSNFYAGRGPQVIVDNLNNVDTGDSLFTGNKCIFGSSVADANQVCLRWSGSGGLRVIGNKFLNGYRGLEFKIGSGSAGSLIIASNSVENAYADQIYFGQGTAGTGLYTKVVVNGNELLGFGDASGIAMQATETASRWMHSLTITANNIEINGDGKGTRPVGISVNQTSKGLVTGNMVVCHNAAASSVAFRIGSSNDNFAHSGNLAYGCNFLVLNSATNQYSSF